MRIHTPTPTQPNLFRGDYFLIKQRHRVAIKKVSAVRQKLRERELLNNPTNVRRYIVC